MKHLLPSLALLGLAVSAWAQQTTPAPRPPVLKRAPPVLKRAPPVLSHPPIVLPNRPVVSLPALDALQNARILLLPESKRIDVDLDNATVREAAQHVLQRRGGEFDVKVDEDVSTDARITLHAKNLSVSTALDLVAQNAGAVWRHEPDADRKTVFVFSKLAAPRDLRNLLTEPPQALNEFLRILPDGKLDSLFTSKLGGLERFTFTCPHCSGKAEVLRERQQPRCPKCARTFQQGWQFCPTDGTKRPAAPEQWRYCPLCGKRVETERLPEAK